MANKQIYYLFCNHWTQGGIGYSFPNGWFNGKKYNRTFSSAYTIHKMLDAADDFPGLKVTMELDSFLYEEVQKEDPECIERLRNYIKEGKAGVEGGTYGQPFGQDYGWEPNIRHLTFGRKAVQEILDYNVKAFLVEEQWFHPQMPQLLLKSGFQYASLQNQNSGQIMPLNEEMINWAGIDGSKLPAIPANDLLVSCVRQYTDYSAYQDKLQKYDRPLLFQWVEVWAPGMDWGASGTPFAKAIRQVLHDWGGKGVALGDYFDLEVPGRKLRDVYIPLDESNYVNNWYQDGGWGYNGDRVIMLDKKTEQAVLAYETLATLQHLQGNSAYPAQHLDQVWRKFMTLQNHDYSGARGYRVVTEEGYTTNSGSLAEVQYGQMLDMCGAEIVKRLQEKTSSTNALTLFNPSGVGHTRTIAVEVPVRANESVVLRQEDRNIPLQILEQQGGKAKALAVVELPAVGSTTVTMHTGAAAGSADHVRSGETWIEDEHIRVEWVPETWKAKIIHKNTGKRVTFAGFTGPIGKVNEHDKAVFPALSPGHEVFSFAFDGATHCPDQVTWPKAEVEMTGPVRSTLKIFSNVLTLHTTPTPVAFAETRVSIDHITGRVECESHFYTGVWLSLQCWAEFTHDFPDAAYVRDFPFGEEKTEIEFVYPNTYTRVESEKGGFTLVHPGVQRAAIKRSNAGGTIRHLIARDKVMGDYTWKFALHFGKHNPWDSASLSQMDHAHVSVVPGSAATNCFLAISDPRVMLSALYREGDATIVRLVNYSAEPAPNAEIVLDHRFAQAELTDFTDNVRSKAALQQKGNQSTVGLSLNPWEIATLALK